MIRLAALALLALGCGGREEFLAKHQCVEVGREPAQWVVAGRAVVQMPGRFIYRCDHGEERL